MPSLCTDWQDVPYADVSCVALWDPVPYSADPCTQWEDVPYADTDCEDLWEEVFE
jgi:hypothetical protein